MFAQLLTDTGSFLVNLKRRRDRGFHVHREMSHYFFKLARRCVRASSFSVETDLIGIYNISQTDAKAMPIYDFLSRSKLSDKLSPTCKLRAEKEMSEKKHEGLNLEAVIAKTKEEFGRSARSYVVFLFKGVQGMRRFTTDIVRGLGAFDLDMMLTDPIDQAAYCFKQLFSSFSLRKMLLADEEPIYSEEYLSFLDELRRDHPGILQPKLLIPDVIDFVRGQSAFKSRLHLIRIFRLSCLGLDEPRQSFPPVKYGSIHTDNLKSPAYDVVTPIQSFLGGSSRSIDVFTSEDSVRRFPALEPTFGNTGLKDTYSPWDSLDHFGRGQIKDVIGPNPTSKQDAPSTSSVAKSTKGSPQFIVQKSPTGATVIC